MPDLEIVGAFHQQVRKHIVHVRVRPLDFYRQEFSGTGCIFGLVRNPKWGNMAFIVTCRHVLKFPRGKHVEVTITRQAVDGAPARVARFTFESGKEANGPRLFWHKEDPPVDIGAILAPAKCTDGNDFLSEDLKDGDATRLGVPMTQRQVLVAEGTRVAWAGYAEAATAHFMDDVLCYYEGVVAHTWNDLEAPLYLLDGHNDRGVSGGPMWYWNDEQQRAELAGVITAYCRGRQLDMPGFTLATAINPFRALIEDVWLRKAKPVPSETQDPSCNG